MQHNLFPGTLGLQAWGHPNHVKDTRTSVQRSEDRGKDCPISKTSQGFDLVVLSQGVPLDVEPESLLDFYILQDRFLKKTISWLKSSGFF